MSDIILTISILCSGRQDTERCLSSLTPILENVPSELIIVDTGCDEKTRAIVDKYATKVIEFEWCDDFAAARNVGVDVACGQWFMFVDDDEWFEEKPTELINFFMSGEYKDYDGAMYSLRSFFDPDMTRFEDEKIGRLFSLNMGTRFYGLVHEYFRPFAKKNKLLNVLAYHSGYINYTLESKLAHSKRNIPLLQKMMQIEPETFRWPYQMSAEFHCLKNFECMKEHCLKYAEKYENSNDFEAMHRRSSFYAGAIIACNEMGDYEQAVEIFEKYKNDSFLSYASVAGLNKLVAEDYYELGQFDDAYTALENYFSAIKGFVDDKDYAPNDACIFLNNVDSTENENEARACMIKSALRCGYYEEAKTVFQETDFSKTINYNVNAKFIFDLIDIFAETDYKTEYSDIARLVYDNAILHDEFVDRLGKKMSIYFEENRTRVKDVLANSGIQMDDMKDPILTISLLCSGREKTTERCLQSLQWIRQELPSEIVIVDTGCDESVRSILKKYSDRIYNFTWCNDFAAARNVGIDNAKGQWFMFIDDDEWFFERPSDLIEFFKSGEYKSFDKASYRIRNYTDEALSRYVDTSVLRLFSINNGERFHGIVHEYVKNSGNRCRYLEDMVGHTGYINVTEEDERRHSARNTPLLLEMIKREPDVFRWPYHLMYEYYNVGEYSKLKELCEQCIEKFSNPKNDDLSELFIRMPSIYAGMIIASIKKRDMITAVADYKRFIKEKKLTATGRAGLCMYGATACFEAGNFKDAYDACKGYIDIADDMRNKREKAILEKTFFMDNVFEDENYYGVKYVMAKVCLYIGETSKAYDVISDIKTTGIIDKGICGKFAYDFVDYVCSVDENMLKGATDVECLVNIIRKLLGDETTRYYFKKKVQSLFENKKNDGLLIKLLIMSDCDDSIVDYARVKAISIECNSESMAKERCLKEDIENSFIRLSKNVDWLTIPLDMWELLNKDGIDVKRIVCSNSLKNIIKAMDYMTVNMKKEDIENRISFIADAFGESTDKRLDYMIFKANEAIMIQTQKNEWRDFEELNELLYAWSNGCTAFYAPYYTSDAYQGDMDLLPDNLKLAYSIRPIFEIGIEHYKEVLMLLKELVGIYEPMSDAISAYSSLYGKFVVDNI